MIDWQKNEDIIKQYNIKRSPIDYILPIFITTIVCYALTLIIMMIAGQWFNIKFFIDTVQKVGGFGIALSLLAFTPRIYRANILSSQTHIDKEDLYTESDLKSKFSDIDIIAFFGCLIAVLTSLLLTPLYH